METISNRDPIQHRSHSLIEFLLGDGIHPGWLDEQRHHRFGSIALRLPGLPRRSDGKTVREKQRQRRLAQWRHTEQVRRYVKKLPKQRNGRRSRVHVPIDVELDSGALREGQRHG